MEANFYYAGLSSAPLLVARTSTTPWRAPTGLEAYRKLKELRLVGSHVLNEVWEDNLALKVHALLHSMDVKWTSTDVVRIGNAGESSAPVILWIGVMPESLSGEDGKVMAVKCWELLEEYDITDVDVEIRESVVTQSAGPKLLEPTFSSDPTLDAREPLTATLGLPICAQLTPWAEGTGGFFITLARWRQQEAPPRHRSPRRLPNTSPPTITSAPASLCSPVALTKLLIAALPCNGPNSVFLSNGSPGFSVLYKDMSFSRTGEAIDRCRYSRRVEVHR